MKNKTKINMLLDEIEDLKPVLEIDEDGIDGTYYYDGSGSLYLTVKNKNVCNWWESESWGVENGRIEHHIEYLDDDIAHTTKQLKIMKRARTILKSKIKKINK